MSGAGVENGRWITAHKSKGGKVVERDARMADRLYFCDRRRSWIDSPRNSAWQCPQPHKGAFNSMSFLWDICEDDLVTGL